MLLGLVWGSVGRERAKLSVAFAFFGLVLLGRSRLSSRFDDA